MNLDNVLEGIGNSIERELSVNRIDDLTLRQKEILLKHFRYAYVAGYEEGQIKSRNADKEKIEQLYNGEVIDVHDNMADAARAVGVHRVSISRVVNGMRSHCRGYVFRFANKTDKD